MVSATNHDDTKSHSRLQQEMCEFIQARTNGRVQGLIVLLESDRARVTGRAASWHVRQLAERAVLEFLTHQPRKVELAIWVAPAV